jgi:hypothetical protein
LGSVRYQLLDRSDETIPATRQSLYEQRVVGTVMQDCTNAADAEIQSFLKVNEGGVIPDLMPEFLSRHQFAWLQGEHREDFGGLGLESENFPVLA